MTSNEDVVVLPIMDGRGVGHLVCGTCFTTRRPLEAWGKDAAVEGTETVAELRARWTGLGEALGPARPQECEGCGDIFWRALPAPDAVSDHDRGAGH